MSAPPNPKPVVLVVDDAPVCLAIARTALLHEGYDVVAATTGTQALSILETTRPDLIVLDVQLPDIDGYKICERIQQHDELSYVPIIFASAVRTGEEDRARAFALGAVDCLVKPLDRNEFVASVARHLATRRHWESLHQRDDAPVSIENAPNFAAFRMSLAHTLPLTDEQRDRLAVTRPINLYDLCSALKIDSTYLAGLVAEFLDLPFLEQLDPTRLALGRLPAPFCARNLVVALEQHTDEEAFAMSNPFDLGLQQTLRRWKGSGAAPHIVITPPANIQALFEETSGAIVLQAEASVDDPAGGAHQHAEALEGMVTEESAPLVRLVNSLIEQADAMRASDIHIEPMEDSVVVRCRIDGRLRQMNRFRGRVLARPIASRIKVMADLDIVERRLPQDGRIAFRRYSSRSLDLDLRVATTPMQHGEKIVVRLLPRSGALLPLADLGFSETNLVRYREKLMAPHGMILHVGPTGSGKSMTLYAALNELRDPTLNIQTAEDPIEYTLPGINQLQVQPGNGLTFARALRAFLRQDPDVILVGEIRDRETATVALEAALTGHLLFSTLHTNDAASTIVRLLEMGIEPYLVSSSLLAVCAQRLLRRLCSSCREPYEPEEGHARLLGAAPGERLTIYRPRGCAACSNIGYKGRVGIHELLIPDHELRMAITSPDMTTERLKQFAVERSGLVTLYWDAVDKVRAGFCSFEEVLSEIAQDEFETRPHRLETAAVPVGLDDGDEDAPADRAGGTQS